MKSGRCRTSPLWTEPKADFQARVFRCGSVSEIVRSFGFAIGSTNHKRVIERIEAEDIDVSHIPRGLGANKGRVKPGLRRHVTEYLHVGSRIASARLKYLLIRDGLMAEECAECGVGPEWRGKPLSIQLDHINGEHEDNRFENLRLLCPNCHSQTETFCGRRLGSRCVECGGRNGCQSERCVACSNKLRPRVKKFEIEKEDLRRLVWTFPTSKVAQDLGVSDKAVEKRCKALGVAKPPRGYWQRKAA